MYIDLFVSMWINMYMHFWLNHILLRKEDWICLLVFNLNKNSANNLSFLAPVTFHMFTFALLTTDHHYHTLSIVLHTYIVVSIISQKPEDTHSLLTLKMLYWLYMCTLYVVRTKSFVSHKKKNKNQHQRNVFVRL